MIDYKPVVLDTENPPINLPSMTGLIVDLEIALEDLLTQYANTPMVASMADADETLPRQKPDCILLNAHDQQYALVRVDDGMTARASSSTNYGKINSVLYHVKSDSEQHKTHSIVVMADTELLNQSMIYDPIYCCFVHTV